MFLVSFFRRFNIWHCKRNIVLPFAHTCVYIYIYLYIQHEVHHPILVGEITRTVSLLKCWWGGVWLLAFLPVLFGTWSFHTASTPSYLGWCHYSSAIVFFGCKSAVIVMTVQCDLVLVWEDCQIRRDCVNVGTFRNHWMLCGSVGIGTLKGNRVECCAALWALAC